MPVQCPSCRNMVEPVRTAQGAMCPSCRRLMPGAAPRPLGYAQPGAPAYAAGRPPYGQPRTHGLATASLVCGIVGIIPYIGWVTGILAIVFGIVALVKISNSGGALKGKGMAITGIVLGVVFPVLSIIFAAVIFVLVNNAGTGGGDRAPDLGFTVDHGGRTLSVIKAPVGRGAVTYDTRSGGDGIFFRSDNPSCRVSSVNGSPLSDSRTVQAADVIAFVGCDSGDTVSVVHGPSGDSVYFVTWT